MKDELENLGGVEIKLSEGIKWAAKYRTGVTEDEDEAKKKIDGYLIPLATLNQVLDQQIDAVRAYKGINNAGEQVLMFVGAVLDPKTGIYRDVFKKGITAENDGEDVVYDSTRPCPPYGDPESPL